MYATLEDIKFQPQLIDPKAAKSIGRAKAAVLMQMIYWSKKSHHIIDKRKWFYNPIREWNKQISYYSESTIKRAIHFLEKHGFIISRKMSAKRCDHTKWYSIVEEEVVSFFKELHKECNYVSVKTTNNIKISSKLLHNKLGQNDKIDRVILTNSITKNTTKTTNSSSIGNDETNNKDIDPNGKEKKKNKNNFDSIVELENTILKSKHSSLYQPRKQERTSLVSKHKTTYTDTQSVGLSKRISQEKDSISSSKKNHLTDEKFQSVYAMKSAWNKIFESSLTPINAYVSKENANYLYELLKEKFDGDIEQWKAYAMLVNSSKFLMGEKETNKNFKAHFVWLIQHETIDRILSGGYGIGDRILDQDNLSENTERAKRIIVEKTVRKFSECIKSKISERSEREEFNSYLLNNEYNNDGDRYQIKDMVRGRSAEGMVLLKQEQLLYNTLYESYISKKYVGLSYFERQTEITKLLDNLSSKNTGVDLIKMLKNACKKIDIIDFAKTQIGEVYQMISA